MAPVQLGHGVTDRCRGCVPAGWLYVRDLLPPHCRRGVASQLLLLAAADRPACKGRNYFKQQPQAFNDSACSPAYWLCRSCVGRWCCTVWRPLHYPMPSHASWPAPLALPHAITCFLASIVNLDAWRPVHQASHAIRDTCKQHCPHVTHFIPCRADSTCWSAADLHGASAWCMYISIHMPIYAHPEVALRRGGVEGRRHRRNFN